MKNNVIITVFDVESEAYQAFNELRRANVGEGYSVPEAALLKNTGNVVELLDGFSVTTPGSDTAKGIVIGSLVGLLGGPIGVILGATTGAMVGSTADAGQAIDEVSLVAILASKILDGETAIAALVIEEEPAFDAAFARYKTNTLRYDASYIAEEVERLKELESAISSQVVDELKAERKAEREERRAERRAALQAKIDERAKVDAATNKVVMDLRPI